MKLYNQTNRPLSWEISLTRFTCQPYGEVTVPDMFVEHCKIRGLPLDVTPVAPEIKASKTLEESTEVAKKDEIVALQKQITEAFASEKSAKSELEKVLGEKNKLEQDKVGLSLSVSNAESKFKTLVSDHAALNELLEKQTKELEVCKQERDRAVATLSELNKAASSAKEEKPAKK